MSVQSSSFAPAAIDPVAPRPRSFDRTSRGESFALPDDLARQRADAAVAAPPRTDRVRDARDANTAGDVRAAKAETDTRAAEEARVGKDTPTDKSEQTAADAQAQPAKDAATSPAKPVGADGPVKLASTVVPSNPGTVLTSGPAQPLAIDTLVAIAEASVPSADGAQSAIAGKDAGEADGKGEAAKADEAIATAVDASAMIAPGGALQPQPIPIVAVAGFLAAFAAQPAVDDTATGLSTASGATKSDTAKSDTAKSGAANSGAGMPGAALLGAAIPGEAVPGEVLLSIPAASTAKAGAAASASGAGAQAVSGDGDPLLEGTGDAAQAGGSAGGLLLTAKELVTERAAKAATATGSPDEQKASETVQSGQPLTDFAALLQHRATRHEAGLAGAALTSDLQPGMTGQSLPGQPSAAQIQANMTLPTPMHVLPVEIGMKAMAGMKQFEIRLDPAELGRVDVKLDISDSGEVSARLVVDRVETLHLLQRDARTLERAFEQAGLKASNAGVEVSLRDQSDSSAFRQQRQQDDSPRRNRDRTVAGSDDDMAISAASTPLRSLVRLGGVDLSI